MNRLSFRSFPVALVVALLLISIGCGDSTPKTADVAVLRVVNGFAENRPVAIWEALPESYQKDVHDIVHTTIGKVDAGLYDQSTAFAIRVTKLLKDKKKFILGSPMAGQIPNKAEVEKQWDAVVTMLETVLTSELGKHETAKKVDVGAFLDRTGSKIMEDMTNLAKLVPGGGEGPGEPNEWVQLIDKAKKVKATLVKEDGDKATVKMETPGEKTEEAEFVRVEGKWIPKEMADGWKEGVAEAKKEIDANITPEMMKKAKEQATAFFAMAGGLLETLEKANTQEEFDAAVGSMMQMLGGQ